MRYLGIIATALGLAAGVATGAHASAGEVKAIQGVQVERAASMLETPAQLDAYVQNVAALHASGMHILEQSNPGVETTAADEYNLGAELLTSDGGDYLQSAGSWAGFGVKLGAPEFGLNRALTEYGYTCYYDRLFTGGSVWVVPAGTPCGVVLKVAPGRRTHSTFYGTVSTELLLKAGEGAVLVDE